MCLQSFDPLWLSSSHCVCLICFLLESKGGQGSKSKKSSVSKESQPLELKTDKGLYIFSTLALSRPLCAFVALYVSFSSRYIHGNMFLLLCVMDCLCRASGKCKVHDGL